MEQKFNDIIAGHTPVLVDFYADWCGPCRVQAPILQQVAGHVGDQARILKIDVDRNNALAARYGIRSIPTLLLFKNGEVVWRHSGVQQFDQLVALLNQHA